MSGSDFPSFDESFFALAVAERLFDGLVFGRAFLAAGFGFWDFAFALLSFSQRAFTAALILALAAER